jgi:hypothetical protein
LLASVEEAKSRVDELSRKHKSAQALLRHAQEKLWELDYGLKIGSIVEITSGRGASGQRGLVVHLEHGWNKPRIRFHPQKLDGSWSRQHRYLYDETWVVVGEDMEALASA